jgi:hypothetical protein
MVQSRYMDHSAGMSALPVKGMTNKEANAFLTANASEVLKARGYPKHH